MCNAGSLQQKCNSFIEVIEKEFFFTGNMLAEKKLNPLIQFKERDKKMKMYNDWFFETAVAELISAYQGKSVIIHFILV